MAVPTLRVVFFGTPEFAVSSLEAIYQAGFQIVGVVTAPDKPSGRGLKVQSSPVKDFAVANGLYVLQPEKLKNEAFLEELASLQADVFVIVAFRMLPETVWDMPPKGTFNLHASLLPAYRGAAPIHWAIVNGETETGVTTFFLQHEIDTGNIILQEKEPIGYQDTVGDLYERLRVKGSKLVVKTLELIQSNEAEAKPQLWTEHVPHAPKIFKEQSEIQWDVPAEKIRNLVRGMNPFPGAWGYLNGKYFKIHIANVGKCPETDGKPGKIFCEGKSKIWVGTQDFSLSLEELQAEGKKKMTAQEFLIGNTI